ncbi:hypothetical protein ACWKSP_40125 [Micromonosporaceae bacterium Da 78-11]
MNFTEATQLATRDLTAGDDDELAEAALHLALQAWRTASGPTRHGTGSA